MTKVTYKLELPGSIRKAAERLAEEDGVSLNEWIASAVAHKVGAMETAADFFRRRAGDAQTADLHALLALVSDRAPEPADEMPPGVVETIRPGKYKYL